MKTNSTLVVRNKSEVLYLCLDSILYVQADGNYCNIFLTDGGVINTLTYQRAEIARMIERQHPTVWRRSFALLGRSYLNFLPKNYTFQTTRSNYLMKKDTNKRYHHHEPH